MLYAMTSILLITDLTFISDNYSYIVFNFSYHFNYYCYFCYFCISQENKEASISEIHEFVKKIPSLTLAHKILDQHINIAEKIKQVCGIIYCDSMYDYVILLDIISYNVL